MQASRGDLDPQVEVMLDLLNDYDISLSADSVEAARTQLEAMVDLGGADPVELDEVSDVTVPLQGRDLPARVYRPGGSASAPVVAFFHGGGFVLGSLDSHDNLCRLLADRSGCVVVSVGYRLAPEHPWPAPVKDAYHATDWLARNADTFGGDGSQLAVAGDSAGGTFAAVVSLLARERGMPDVDRQVLLYPAVTYLEAMPSRAENGSGYFLTARDMLWFLNHYVDDEFDAHNPLAFPMQARDLSDLPPAFVLTCGYDPLRDEGVAYADRLQEAGVDVTHENFEGMIHGFLQMEAIVDRAYDGVDAVAEYLRAWADE